MGKVAFCDLINHGQLRFDSAWKSQNATGSQKVVGMVRS